MTLYTRHTAYNVIGNDVCRPLSHSSFAFKASHLKTTANVSLIATSGRDNAIHSLQSYTIAQMCYTSCNIQE